MSPTPKPPLSVGIGGLGAIGFAVAKALDAGIPGLALKAVSARDRDAAAKRVASFKHKPAVVGLADLAELCDVVVECCPAKEFASVMEPAIARGRIVMPLSVGQLLERGDLIERARQTGARIIVPTGALLGLDAVRAAAEGEIRSVRMVSRKPPAGLKGAPYLEQHKIDVDAIKTPTKIFDGSARDGARGFPANVNVAAALSLAGIGPDKTRLEIWADPTVTRNTHTIELDADSVRLTMTTENVPDADNPRTGRNTPLSTIACLRSLTATLKVGT
ncbi:MAG TPA: aspartate dehydrogenase [Candidatus Sulfotelmatobacter sp.]|nr:aspartate dehydrogenase [Candidatus Sulfotelmatobacter sp.]